MAITGPFNVTNDFANDATSLTVSVTVTAGTDQKEIYWLHGLLDSAPAVTSVVRDGQTATSVISGQDTDVNSNVAGLFLYYQDAPNSGTANVVLTASASWFQIGLAAAHFDGVASGAADATASNNSDTTSPVSDTVANTAGVLVVDGFFIQVGSTGNATTETGQSEAFEQDVNAGDNDWTFNGSSIVPSGAGTQTMGWSWTSGSPSAEIQVLAAWAAVGGIASVIPFRRRIEGY